jgi:hypothetical protein
MHISFRRIAASGALAFAFMGGDGADAAKLNTEAFVAACASDETVTEDPAFEGGKVTPKAYCECVAGSLETKGLNQADVDMLTKMHKEEISDSDAESFPKLEDLLTTNEGLEDSCRKSLGLPTDTDDDIDEVPMEDDSAPDDDGAPAQDDGSPPE